MARVRVGALFAAAPAVNEQRHVLIIGGGLAGLSAGCYLRASGYRTTIVEHGLTLGGVCTAWQRGGYTIDGCIQWLTGGPFSSIYTELGILPKVSLRVLKQFVTYRDEQTGVELTIQADLSAVARALADISPEDRAEIQRLMEGAEHFAELQPPIDAPELANWREHLGRMWGMRHELSHLVHFRNPLGTWLTERVRSPQLQRLFRRLLPAEAPTLFLLMMLGYLKRGYLSRPEGGTAAFRDALVDTYRARGGAELLHSTVDEVLVEGDRARGVRLADGEILEGDIVISTASMPETVLRLLQGRYAAAEVRARLERWKLFDPVVLLSYGIALPLHEVPPSLIIDGIEPFDVGGCRSEHLMIRTYNDDPSLAPPGHTVVQLMLPTDYEWWAKRGANYNGEKDVLAMRGLERLDRYLPGVRAQREISDVVTPLTFWNLARAWRGAYEGWIPSSDASFGHVHKVLDGLSGFYMAGQWVEPGGGVPMALMSGRQVAQLVCANDERPFHVR
jgi:phytoene desaturase